jgi:CBS domain-containing protein
MAAASPLAGQIDASTVDQLFAEQGLETTLGRLPCRSPVGVPPDMPLSQALAAMQARQVESILVLDPEGAALGILTLGDVLERVTLPQLSLSCPVRQVMSSPVLALRTADTLREAAVLFVRHGVEQVPLTENGRVVGLLSLKDMQSLQRHSFGRVGGAIAAAGSVEELAEAAHGMRAFARDLLGHDVGARQVSELLSHLNDRLTDRMLQLVAAEQRLDLGRACWLAFGSQGRGEQTIVTDQDNGLVFESEHPARDRERWLELGRRVNEGLSACGFPRCRGHVMAGNPACCLTIAEWCDRFSGWIEHGAPEDLLKACIYFDVRPVAGRTLLAQPLRELVTRQPAGVPRFLKQMADNALRNPVALSWLGTIETRKVGGRPMFDLKHHGTMLFVDAARLYALALGIDHTGTRRRLEAIAAALKVPAHEGEAWVRGFEYLQLLRLQTQASGGLDDASENSNVIGLASLNDIDRRMLNETLRVARRLQQRMQLDYER